MATDLEWREAYDEASTQASKGGRYQYLYAAEAMVLESWLGCPEDERPSDLPDGGDIDYHLDGYIADLDDEAGFSLWYQGGTDALCEDADGKLPHIHTWFYWARYHEDLDEMNDYFISVCEDRDLPVPAWYVN